MLYIQSIIQISFVVSFIEIVLSYSLNTTMTLIIYFAVVTIFAIGLIVTSQTAKLIVRFAYSCFLKPFDQSSHSGGQQSALESFYKGQAEIYDATRQRLLMGREVMLSLSIAHLKNLTSRDLVWVDLGGGTGYNLELMNQILSINNFKAVYLVDLSPSLCKIAQQRVDSRQWKNVFVCCQDVNEFSLSQYGISQADLVTMSYSLSMIPTFYPLIDKIANMVSKDGIVGVIDFYVQSQATVSGNSTWVGGDFHRHVSWLGRTFWRLWFELDRVYLDPSRRDYLEYKFGTIKSVNLRNKKLGQIPYYIWLGCDKHYNPDINFRLNALATESPYLAPTHHDSGESLKNDSNLITLRSKGYEAAVINIEKNLPYPSFFFQKEVWRVFYEAENPKHNQFSEQYIYAFTWEDPQEDIKILNMGENDTVLAISSAGDNLLAYASMKKPPKRIHGVDLNPHQNHLVELKLASLRILDFEDHWKLFGEGKHPNFENLLVQKLGAHLSSYSFQYWMTKGKKAFDVKYNGLYDTGSTRWALRIAKWIFKLCGVEKDVKALCNAQTISEQRRIWETRIRPSLFNSFTKKMIVCNPIFLWKALGVPISQGAMIEGGTEKYLIDTLDPLVSRSLISSENYFYYLCLTGSYSQSNCPDYLTRKCFDTIKNNSSLNNIRLHTDAMQDVVERLTPGSVTCAIVMDHMDWFGPDARDARDEIRALNKSLKKGGKVLLRSSSPQPWYIKVYEDEGFVCRRAALRTSGTSIDRVNMYASTWVCTKIQHLSSESKNSIEELAL